MRMKKHILFVVALLQVFILQIKATDETAPDSIFLGNCQGRGVSFAGNNVTGGALFYPQSYMESYKGNYLECIYLYVNYPSMVKSLRVFLSKNLSEPYDFIFNAQASRTGWNKINLDTPCELDGNGLYLGFIMEGSPVAFAIRRLEGQEYLLADNVWEAYENNTYSIAMYGVIRGNNLPSYDAAWDCRSPLEYALTNTPHTIEGTVTNKGIIPIHELTFTYHHDGNATTETISGLNIDYLGSSHVQLQGPSFSESGNHTLTVELSSINGNPDMMTDDNQSGTFHIQCFDEMVQRNVLMEIFSTELCPNCPAAHRVIDPLADGNERIIRVEHHAGFYTDPYTADASIEYEWFYGTMKYAPAYMVDRTNRYDRFPDIYNYGKGGPVSSVGNVSEVLDDAFHTPAFASVNIEVANESERNYRQIHIHVSGKGLSALPENCNNRLYVHLTEDSILTKSQASSTEEYYHRHVIRQCLTGIWGDPIDLDAGYNESYTAKIPDGWNMSQMNAVAFVGHYNEVDFNDCEVYNSASTSLKQLVPTSIAAIRGKNKGITLKGKNLSVPDGYNHINIYFLNGIVAYSATTNHSEICLNHLPKGIYLYVATGEDGSSTGKIIL